MIYKNYYWFFEKAISKAVCNKIIKHGEAKQLNIALSIVEGRLTS